MAESEPRRSSRIAAHLTVGKKSDVVRQSAAVSVNSNEASNVVNPEDSASQVGRASKVSSSIDVRRLELKAKKAALLAEAALAEERQRLELEEVKLHQRKQQLELQSKLAALEAEAGVLADGDDDERNLVEPVFNPHEEELDDQLAQHDSHVVGQNENYLGVQLKSALDPMAKEFVATPSGESNILSLLKQNQLYNMQMVEALRLPTAQLIPFNGDPLRYWSFIRSFEANVASCAVDDSVKLTRLIHYCTGQARKVVECCAVMPPSLGYARARDLLKDRFGNDYMVLDACLHKIVQGPQIKAQDGARLQEFADDLVYCNEMLAAMGTCNELNNQMTLLKIVNQLPSYLQNRWRREVRLIRERSLKCPEISDIVAFVRGAAIEANDPVYGQLAVQSQEVKSKQSSMRRRRDPTVTGSTLLAMSTEVNTKVNEVGAHLCLLCNSRDHRLFKCPQFRDMGISERACLVKQRKLCFNCLLAGHQYKKCRLNKVCMINGCSKKHSPLLHMQQSGAADSSSTQHKESSSPGVSTVGMAEAAVASNIIGAGLYRSALPIIPVVVRNSSTGVEMRTCALLDSGSTNSFCSVEVAERLMLERQQEMLTLTTIYAEGARVHTTKVDLQLVSLDGYSVIDLPCVYTRKELPINMDNKARLEDIRQWQHLQDIDLLEADNEKVGLLIGQDCPEALMPIEVRRGETGSPYAVKTALGWVINGPLRRRGKQQIVSNFIQSELREQIEKLWKLDGVCERVKPESGVCYSVNDQRALKIWNDSIRFENGHYSLDIPFKDEHPRLPNNLPMAQQRLESLRRRLCHDEGLRNMYKTNMEELLSKSYAERTPRDEISKPEGLIWYLPHHPVFNKNKPDKLRIVFDCAAVYQGVSLNSKTLQGPDLTNKLIGVLLRFRQERFAATADIEAMFHQVKVNSCHRDCLRFLWWPNGNLDEEAKIYRMNVHLFGGVWSPSCCNFALKHTAKQHQAEFDEKVVKSVDRDFYVDDFLKSFATVEQAKELIKQMNSLLLKGGFRLTKWVSNNEQILSAIPECERLTKVHNVHLPDRSSPERALGVKWDIESDKFTFSVIDKDKPATRRGILSVISSVFDPLGLICPFMLPAKRLLQDLCRKNIDWDERIPEAEHEAWSTWRKDHLKLQDLRINRCVKPSDFEETVHAQLHHFCDASRDGYGTASYLRAIDINGRISCHLLIAKSRLSPIKSTTIPRLELQAATLAVRMDELLCDELDVPLLLKSVFWTDSTVVLQYINNVDKRFHTFVANRVAAIHDRTQPSQWRYVNSRLNPADDASRGLKVDELISNKRWFEGPEFLRQTERMWPLNPVNVNELFENDPEIRKDQAAYAASAERDIFDDVFARRSCWYKLKRDIAWLMRVREFLRNKIKGVTSNMSRPLSVTEIEEAEIQVVKIVQRKAFRTECTALVQATECRDNGRKRGIVDKSNQLYKLEPLILNDGLLRVGGRLPTHPIILPKHHYVVDLIIRHYHSVAGHAGREHVLALSREKFWIIGARSAVRRVLKDCSHCKIRQAQPMTQRMADLPSDRITPCQPPFTYVGVDLFGPFTVKRGRSILKRYGCLFTCLAVRAIHIEVVETLETDSFLNALQRFVCRRGQVRMIRSDNGTNFVGAAKELCAAATRWNQNRVYDFLRQKSIEWRFNPPAASHMGGAWERQIRTIRKVLSAVMKQQAVSDECLSTLMCLVESIINSRPLTTVSNDHHDLEPLTPNHLLLLRSGASLPTGEFVKQDLYSRKRWRQVQYLADVFWRRWTREYLPTLQLRRKWMIKTKNLEVGDVVIIADDNAPRNAWALGRVTETFPDSVGVVRSARVSTKTSTFVRPIHKLCLLEKVDK